MNGDVAHVVLVHGGWHGPWCWEEVIDALRERGVEATAVELPSDRVGAGAKQYAEAIAASVWPGTSVVVGHSLAGLALPLVPDLVPVRGLIFLASLRPLAGRSWRDQLATDRPMAEWFYEYALPAQTKDDQGRSVWPPDTARELFFHDCPPEVAEGAAARLRPQAPTPVAELTPLTAFPDVAMRYLIGSDDRAVSVGWARRVAAERLGVEVEIIPGSHSPFLAAPGALADLLSAAFAAEVTS